MRSSIYKTGERERWREGNRAREGRKKRKGGREGEKEKEHLFQRLELLGNSHKSFSRLSPYSPLAL